MLGIGRWYFLANLLRRFLVHRIPRYLVSSLLAVGVAWQCTDNAWDNFKDERRPDGNSGHTAIDFGGQWIMGRMLDAGQGPFLYQRDHLRNDLGAWYPHTLEAPKQETHDADGIMGSFMGWDNNAAPPIYASCLLPLAARDGLGAALLVGVGVQYCWQPSKMTEAARPSVRGPLYPPINAFVYSPLGLLPPTEAYRVMQGALLGFALLSAWGIRQLSQGRIWLPLAFALIVAYPGFSGAQCLGQNSPVTLTILIWGWVLVAADRTGWAGVLWGLLAFKPVWAVAFFLVPLLSRRWRMCFTMVAAGLIQIGLTLPWVGIDAWRDWLAIGQAGAANYNVDKNWIFLSRDLLGIPRRLMLDFETQTRDERDAPEPARVGWLLLAAVVLTTATFAIVRRSQVRAVTGPGAAFLLLGAWLSCYHFMYYDVLLTALPVVLLFTEPRQYLEPGFLAWEPLVLWHEPALGPWETVTPEGIASPRRVSQGLVSFLALPAANYGWVRNPFVLLVVVALVVNEQVLVPKGWLSINDPWDTLAAFVLWLWCGWLWIRQRVAGPKAERAYGELPLTAVDAGR